jgi:phosphoribosylformylglycinamidine synthase
MSPMEIWCNEAQERFVLAIHPDKLPVFEALCERERCPFAVVGRASTDTMCVAVSWLALVPFSLHDHSSSAGLDCRRVVVEDALFNNTPIDLPAEVLFGKPPKMLRDAKSAYVGRVGRVLEGDGDAGRDQAEHSCTNHACWC